MLTYDDVWSTFLSDYKADCEDVPQEEEKIYEIIKNAVLLFNNRLRRESVADDDTETISDVNTTDDKLILAQYIRLKLLRNTRDFYEKLLQGFEGDVGFKNFGSQLVSIRESIKEQEIKINEFIFNTRETFLWVLKLKMNSLIQDLKN